MKLQIAIGALAAVSAKAANSTIVEIEHTQPNGAVVGLNVTFHYSACNSAGKLPLSILLNGAPVLAAQYADVANKMADQGYAVAIPEYSERDVPGIDDPT